jgi:hypothetical protein
MLEKIDAYREKFMATFETDQGKTEARIETDLEEVEAEDLKANTKNMESESDHQEVPKEEAAVKSSRIMKWHKRRHIAAGWRGKPKKLTRGD